MFSTHNSPWKNEDSETIRYKWQGKTSSGATNEDDENIEGTTRVKKWRALKKVASVTREDKTWYWCPKHVLRGKFDGLYVTHKPENHVD